MKEFIKIEGKNIFLLNKDLLGLKKAQLWVGRPDGPKDDDDEKVAARRIEDKKLNPILGIKAVDLAESIEYPGWFKIDTSIWPAGIYRLMLHSKVGIQAPYGTKLNPQARDLQYSWPIFPSKYLANLSEDLKKFLYQEPNKRGFCIRIEITPEREIKPAGDGEKWI
jgi:hypothetical protein